MKYRVMLALLAVAVVGLWSVVAVAQIFGTVKGVCKDADGNPIADAIVRFVSSDTGQKYELKTNKKGEYLSIGIAPLQNYNVTLIKDGKEIDSVKNFKVSSGEQVLDFDVKKNQENALKGQGVTAEQAKEIKKQMEAAAKEQGTVKQLNEKLTAASTASTAGDYDAAITILTEASQLDATRDLIWFKLADAYSQSAGKQSDAAEKTKRLDTAVEDYQKAIDIKKKDMAEETKPDAARTAKDNQSLAGYYNSLGTAYSKQGKTDDAVKAFNTAAQIDPADAGMFYFNQGAIMTNGGHLDEAIAAFDKALAADPKKAAAYYWKGVNMMGKATMKDNKMVAPPGTEEAFNKYLELEPTGPYADASKQMLATMGATIETSYGKKKTTPTKK